MKRTIAIIINPASGIDTPILAPINRILQTTDYIWDFYITKKQDDAQKFARAALKKRIDIVAVFGGDGTIAEVAKVLCHTNTKLAIIPGGSANVVANSLNIPLNIEEAMKLVVRKKLKIKKIDMLLYEKKTVLLGFNIGMAAKAVQNTDRVLKDRIGQLAYGITALKDVQSMEDRKYTFNLDGKEITTHGVALMIVNAMNIKVAGVSLISETSITDGYMDIICVKKPDAELLFEVIKTNITNKAEKRKIKSWKGKKVNIQVDKSQTVMCDDEVIDAANFDISVLPKALNVITA